MEVLLALLLLNMSETVRGPKEIDGRTHSTKHEEGYQDRTK